MNLKVITLGLLLLTGNLQAQITFQFQSSVCNARDAPVYFINGLPAYGATNLGSLEELIVSAWTYYGIGGTTGFSRFYIDFTGMDQIPQGSTVLNAVLRLYGKNTSILAPQGNTTPNACWIERVTSPWTQNTLTWNNQPTVTTVHQTVLPASTSQWNYNAFVNVTTLVQDIVNQVPAQRYGFSVRLQLDSIFRSLVFASAENNNAALRPQLEVTISNCGGPEPITLPQAPGMQPIPDLLTASPTAGIVFRVIPNPVKNNARIEFTAAKAEWVDISLQTLHGQPRRRKQVQTHKGLNVVPFDVGNEPAGVYYVILQSAAGKTTQKMVIVQ
ncbi:DNRLRE domain-containing protein [Chitinophaga nivalis]|uniref:DNRLRE domain-containing protein n=1 Tax=Chitinophaga nivalis TaxID=2991709 RepID=A0ABT3II51_9BACT|nr:DNRLRE domain-containing protein [Chitinophaga nivalis]MCW3466675.1 DNRLRE domain-containing protein [Chitinophaga nivalis]MCW3483634.1 DNRLRE domain-containing protein [Chitinophaga nivalis]